MVIWLRYSNNLKLPVWTDPIYLDVLDAVEVRVYELLTETPYMTRSRGGLFLNVVILQQMVHCPAISPFIRDTIQHSVT